MILQLGMLMIGVLVVGFLGYMIASALSGRYEPILLTWALFAPLGYCLLAYPLERPVITLHRAIILPLSILVFLLPPLKIARMSLKQAWMGIVWGLFVLGIVTSFVNSPRDLWLSAVRVMVDAFILPLVLAWVVYRSFHIRRHLSWLHTVFSMMSTYLLIIGAYEMTTGKALLSQWNTNGVLYAGVGSFQIVRPAGPFPNPGIFSLVGMINVFLLLFCSRAIEKKCIWNRLLHWPGIVSALAVSLMTLTRGVVITYFIILVVQTWRQRGIKQRISLMACAMGLIAIVGTGALYAPTGIAEERFSSENFLGRVVQQTQTLRVFQDHPITGVGFCNFISAAGSDARYDVSFDGVGAVGAPHNLLGEILAETGLIGAIPFVISQILVVVVFWDVRVSHSAGGNFVWAYFVMIFLAFWVMNMDFTLGYYSELNLWFVFAITVLYKYAVEANAVKVAAVKPARFYYRGCAMNPVATNSF